MDQCLDDIEAEDEFDALMYSRFPEDEDEETDPIPSILHRQHEQHREDRKRSDERGDSRSGWHLDLVTGEYRKMQASLDEARRPYVSVRYVRSSVLECFA